MVKIISMNNHFDKSFGNKIKDLREDRDMSQSEIAALIPMNQSNYSKIERDIQEPDLFQLKRIAEIFGISCDELLGISKSSDEVSKALEFTRRVTELYNQIYKK